MKSIGFTGTREGMSPQQKNAVELLLIEASPNPVEIVAHHGDCVGADADFHAICRSLGVSKIVAHPPDVNTLRAFTDADEVRPPKPYLVRNADIVTESDQMYATPAEDTERSRGGTWSTIRRARKDEKPLAVVLPDGRVTG